MKPLWNGKVLIPIKMNNITDFIEVPKTTLRDCREIFFWDITITGFLCCLIAVLEHFYFICLIVFIFGGLFRPCISTIITLRTPYRVEFTDGYVKVYYRSFWWGKIKTIPYKNVILQKELWHQKRKQSYSVSFFDKKKQILPSLTSMSHWDNEALDRLLNLAEQNGITVKVWDYPIRWGK